MRKYIAIRDGRSIKKYNLSKVIAPMTTIGGHLYRLDAVTFHMDKGSGDAIQFTDLESTQFYGDGNIYIDPNDTMAMLDTVPNGTKKVYRWNKLTAGNGMVYVYMAIAVIMVLSFIGKELGA